MPFKSEKQRRYLWANKPEIARKFTKESKLKKKIKSWRKNGNKKQTSKEY